jgi:hypothetical protein
VRRLFGQSLLALTLLLGSSSMAAHKVVDFQGKVVLQRKRPQGWSAPFPLRRRGVSVVSDDRIEVKTGSEALVRCASRGNKLWSVEPGGPYPVSRGCGVDAILRLARREAGLPGGGDPRLPYVIQPRATLVREGPVSVSWHPVAGVAGYQVWLVRQRDQRLLWGARVTNIAATTLPQTVPLVAGEAYLFVVEADDGSSSQLDPGAPHQGFRRATMEEERRLERNLAELPLGKLDPEATQLLRADIQRSHGFIGAAINTLEETMRERPNSLGILLDLGELYSLVGLNKLASERFNQAAALAAAERDTESLTEAQSGASQALERLRSTTP